MNWRTRSYVRSSISDLLSVQKGVVRRPEWIEPHGLAEECGVDLMEPHQLRLTSLGDGRKQALAFRPQRVQVSERDRPADLAQGVGGVTMSIAQLRRQGLLPLRDGVERLLDGTAFAVRPSNGLLVRLFYGEYQPRPQFEPRSLAVTLSSPLMHGYSWR